MSDPAQYDDGSEIWPEREPSTYYHGRKWDAPMTDFAEPMDAELLSKIVGQPCAICQEPMQADENLFIAMQATHLECPIRAGLGDVQHLEGRCGTCSGSIDDPYPGEDDQSFRQQALATVAWMVAHRKGRFYDDRADD